MHITYYFIGILKQYRLHPKKCQRPFASGSVPLSTGLLAAPLLLLAAALLASQVSMLFLGCLIIYFILTCAYSVLLKRLVLVDCFTLALLYTLRIIAGGAAVNISLSFWLLAFSVFVFLSLALLKRYAELELMLQIGQNSAHGRGYSASDNSLIQSMGVAAGYSSALILALYLNSEAVRMLYSFPELVWLSVPLMLFWISWMWMQAHRGAISGDPLVFAVKDPVSLALAIGLAAIMTTGSLW